MATFSSCAPGVGWKRSRDAVRLLHHLTPDHKSIAEFRRLNGEAIARTTGKLVKFAKSVELVKGEWAVSRPG